MSGVWFRQNHAPEWFCMNYFRKPLLICTHMLYNNEATKTIWPHVCILELLLLQMHVRTATIKYSHFIFYIMFMQRENISWKFSQPCRGGSIGLSVPRLLILRHGDTEFVHPLLNLSQFIPFYVLYFCNILFLFISVRDFCSLSGQD